MWAVLLLCPYLECRPFTICIDQDSLKYTLRLLDVSSRRERWRILQSKLDFDVPRQAGVNHQSANAFSTSRTGGEETTDLEDDLTVGNVQNTQVWDDDTSHVHDCTECDVEKDLIGQRDSDAIKKRHTKASTVLPTQRKTMRCEKGILEGLAFEQMYNGYCRKSVTKSKSIDQNRDSAQWTTCTDIDY